MSTLTDYITGRPGVLYLGNTDQAAAATTLPDLTGTLSAGTEINSGVSRNGWGVADGPTGHSLCWGSSGSESRGFQIAAAATATLQLQVLSLGWFFKQVTSATNGPIHLGRQNGIYGAVGSSQKMGAAMGGGVTLTRGANPTPAALNSWHYAVVTYDGHELGNWLDGFPEGVASVVPGPFTTFASRVCFGGDTGQTGAGHRLALPHIFNRVLTPGEIATIARLGIGNPTSDHQANFDYVADGVSTLISGASSGANCMGCGGRRRTNEGGYKSAASSPAHEGSIACVGAAGLHLSDPAAPLTASPTSRDLDVAHARLAKQVVDSYGTRPSTAKPWYQLSTGAFGGSGWTTQSYGGYFGALGILHRHQTADAYSSLLTRMKTMMGYFASVQIPSGNTFSGYFSNDGTDATSWGGNFIFTFSEMLAGAVAVWDILDSTTKTAWLDVLRAAAAGIFAVERNFWPNGNYVFYYWSTQRVMAVLDPVNAATWQANADTYLAYLFAPSGTHGYTSGSIATIGVRRYVDGTPTNDPLMSLATMRGLDVTSDKIYATEGNGTATGAGSTYNTTYGFDPNYVGAQADIALRIYLLTGDSDAWKLTQLLANAIVTRQNFSTSTATINGQSVPAWYSENRGTRHNASELNAGGLWHTMRRLGRTDLITAQQVADRHNAMIGDAVLNTTQQNVWYRTAVSYAQVLMASPYWPELDL